MSVTDSVEKVLTATTFAVLERKNGNSWRALGESLGVPHGILHAIGTGAYSHVSWLTIRKVCVRLGLDDPGDVVHALPCPDCGSAHTGRCHGKPVARVVIVSGKPRNRKKYHRPCLDDAEYARFLEWRRNA